MISLQSTTSIGHADDCSFQKCGQSLYDDYTELQPGAILKLEQLLKQYCSERHVPNDVLDSAGNAMPSRRQVGIITGCVEFCSKIWGSNQKGSSLPRHQQSKLSTAELAVCSVAPGNGQGDHNFLLLCVPFMRLVAKLWQAEVCKINSDQDFFHVLRYYYNQHGRRSWARLRKVDAIHFVKASHRPKILAPLFLILLAVTIR